MTRYRVPVAQELLDQRPWRGIAGFRLITVNEPWAGGDGVMICTFEDDGAPAGLEGALVDPMFTRHADGRIEVTGRNLVR